MPSHAFLHKDSEIFRVVNHMQIYLTNFPRTSVEPESIGVQRLMYHFGMLSAVS